MNFRWPQGQPIPVKMGTHELDDGTLQRYVEFAGGDERVLTEEEFAEVNEGGLKALAEILDAA